jgi:hypothetical protein
MPPPLVSANASPGNLGVAAKALGTGSSIVLHAYDAAGNRLSWSAFRALQTNGKGSNGQNDALLDPVTLRVRSMWPLRSSNGTRSGDPSLQVPSVPAALALAWPTSDGYSNLIMNLPVQAGTYVFNQLAAQQVISDLTAAHAARPWYMPSTAEIASESLAQSKGAEAGKAASEAQVGASSAQALDAAVHAEMLLLSESGIQYAIAHRAMGLQPEWGFTFDDISRGISTLRSVADLTAPSAGDAWIRIVFNLSESPGYYANEIANAHALGLHVVGQILDSSDMRYVSGAAWQSRVQAYVASLPSVDEWEVGNEVNGNWLGSDVVGKISYAAAYIKQHTHARTLLTLYWQLGEDAASDSMFTWAAANLSSSVMTNIDDLGISLYPEADPMGSAFDRVMNTLHAQFPAQRLLVTELDYGSPDLQKTWWWASPTDLTGPARIAVAKLYQSAVLSYPYSGGGTFWWYYVEEAQEGNPLWNALASLHQAVAGGAR